MTTPDGPKSYSGPHVVTRPNPDVVGVNTDPESTSSAGVLRNAPRVWTAGTGMSPFGNKPAWSETRKVLFHSFADIGQRKSLVLYQNGFVHGIIRAFQQDLHLVLRPDDVWLAIMVQFSFYVNGHAEEMRHFFVKHEGKRQLLVDTGGSSPLSVDFGKIAQAFRDLIQENVVDPDLTSWILPSFSTTTSEDITTTTIVMMATTQEYFEFMVAGGCGFPGVALLGERADWVKLLEKVEKLAVYGGEVADWSRLLAKVVGKMIQTYDQPDSPTTKDFWMRAVHQAGASGSTDVETLSGWVTAFCYWSEEGFKITQYSDEDIPRGGRHVDRKRLIIDNVAFPMISFAAVPQSVAEVPVKLVDYRANVCYETTAIAGPVGMEPSRSREGGPHDVFQARSGYWILLDKTGPIPPDLLRDRYDMKRI